MVKRIDGPPCSRPIPPYLKLVYSRPAPNQEGPLLPSGTEVATAVHSKGHDMYEIGMQDPSLDLACTFCLQIGEWEGETVAVCHFPVILDEQSRLLHEDETLYGMLMVQFQINVLWQLFLFCINHDASRLFIYMDDDQAEGFAVYHDFIEHLDETFTAGGEKTEMVFPVNRKASVRLRKFIQKTTTEFEKDLWREQHSNPVIRAYLKAYAKRKIPTQKRQPAFTEGGDNHA